MNCVVLKRFLVLNLLLCWRYWKQDYFECLQFMSIVGWSGGIHTGFLCFAVCKLEAKLHQNETNTKRTVHRVDCDQIVKKMPFFLFLSICVTFPSHLLLNTFFLKKGKFWTNWVWFQKWEDAGLLWRNIVSDGACTPSL